MLFNKLQNSKWTSLKKCNGWYHYQVLNIYKKDKKVEMFAVCNKEIKIIISIYELKDKLKWIQGWKDIAD